MENEMNNKLLTKDTPWDEVPEDVKKWYCETIMKNESEWGKLYPTDFLSDISDTALLKVCDWLQNNNAPENIYNLAVDGHVLKMMIAYRLEDPNCEEIGLLEYVTRITKTLYNMGESFAGI